MDAPRRSNVIAGSPSAERRNSTEKAASAEKQQSGPSATPARTPTAPSMADGYFKSNITDEDAHDSEAQKAILDVPPNVDEVNEALIMKMTSEPYFHGELRDDDITDITKENGDFLVRTLEKTRETAVSVRVGSSFKDFPLKFLVIGADGKERRVTMNGIVFQGDIKSLIDVHMRDKIPVEPKVFLVRPVPKQAWQLPKENIRKDEKIGEGQFGSVWKGVYNTEKDKKSLNVAIKVTKICEANKAKTEEMLVEARMMRQFQHENVVQFYGMVSDGAECMIVMELVGGGSLDKWMKKYPDFEFSKRCSFLFDVAYGLYYLHSKRIIHRDVASRNCLVDDTKNVAKISDFGMSKQGIEYKIHADEMTPIRWQAPEVIKTKLYTRECDIYSYGMIVYEVFANGAPPFEGIENKDIRKKIQDPKFRPPIPERAKAEVPEIMRKCWEADPKDRPQLRWIAGQLKKYKFSKRDKGEKGEKGDKAEKSGENPPASRSKSKAAKMNQSTRNTNKKSSGSVAKPKQRPKESVRQPRKKCG